MLLHKLLLNIQAGEAINPASLLKALPKQIDWRLMFDISDGVAKNKNLIRIIDEDKFATLLKQSEPPKTRSDAASHDFTSSHTISCDSAYMLCFPLQPLLATPVQKQAVNNKFSNGEPVSSRELLCVASVKQTPLPSLFLPAKKAILIENQDCFFEWQSFLSHFKSSISLSECDIYFAGGKRILNKAFAPFLQQYECLYCAFDYDFDGLNIANHISNKNYTNTLVLIPDKLSTLSALFTFQPQNLEKLMNALSLCKSMGINELHEIMDSSQHFMEQEALLTLAKHS